MFEAVHRMLDVYLGSTAVSSFICRETEMHLHEHHVDTSQSVMCMSVHCLCRISVLCSNSCLQSHQHMLLQNNSCRRSNASFPQPVQSVATANRYDSVILPFCHPHLHRC